MNSKNSSEEQRQTIPDGYQPIKSLSGFGNHIGPFYIKDNLTVGTDDITRLGLKLEEQHGGAPGRGHGGVTMTLLDEVIGRSASLTAGKLCVTVSMTTNFCSGALLGDFLIGRAWISHRARKVVFLEASVHAGETLIATSTGIWKDVGVPIPGWLDKPEP